MEQSLSQTHAESNVKESLFIDRDQRESSEVREELKESRTSEKNRWTVNKQITKYDQNSS